MVVWDFFGDYHRNPKNGVVVQMISFSIGYLFGLKHPLQTSGHVWAILLCKGGWGENMICYVFIFQNKQPKAFLCNDMKYLD